MKILIFNTLYHPNVMGGAEKSVQLLAENLAKEGHQTVVVSTERNVRDRVEWINGVKVYYLRPRNLYWSKDSSKRSKLLKPIWHALDIFNPFFKKVITNIVKEEGPDVIHTNNLAGFSVVPWVIAKEIGIPVVHTLRDYYLMCIKSTMYKNGTNCNNRRCKLCAIYTYYKKLLSNRQYVNYLVGISDFIIRKHKYFGYFIDVPSRTIFNGIEIPHIKESKDDCDNNKDLIMLRPLKFFYMGRIEKNKGVELLLKEFQEVTNAELYLAGKIYDKEIDINIGKNKYGENIHFLGFVDPREILPTIDVLIVPSLWNEPFGRVIIEAYSYGKPVIASNRGGIPEIVIDGVTGYIFNPDIEGDLREKINKMTSNPQMVAEMSENIPKNLNNFVIQQMVKQYLEVYSEVIDRYHI